MEYLFQSRTRLCMHLTVWGGVCTALEFFFPPQLLGQSKSREVSSHSRKGIFSRRMFHRKEVYFWISGRFWRAFLTSPPPSGPDRGRVGGAI